MTLDDLFKEERPDTPIIMDSKDYFEKSRELFRKMSERYSASWYNKQLSDDEYPDQSICDKCTGCGTTIIDSETVDCYQDKEDGSCYYRFVDYEEFGSSLESLIEDIHNLCVVDDISDYKKPFDINKFYDMLVAYDYTYESGYYNKPQNYLLFDTKTNDDTINELIDLFHKHKTNHRFLYSFSDLMKVIGIMDNVGVLYKEFVDYMLDLQYSSRDVFYDVLLDIIVDNDMFEYIDKLKEISEKEESSVWVRIIKQYLVELETNKEKQNW